MSNGELQDFDDVTSFLGDYGRFQITMIVFLSLSVIPSGYMGFVVVFVSDTPEFHCKVNPNWTNIGNNVTELHFLERSRTIGPDGCSKYKVNLTWTEVPLRNYTEPCEDGWEFSNDTYTATTVSEWGLVCDNAWKVPFSTSLFFVGVLIGSFISGHLSDQFGRKPIFFITMAIQTITALIQAASFSWVMFSVFNCLRGLGQISNYTASLVLGCELLRPRARVAYTLVGHCVGFGMGYAFLALFGYFIRDWRMMLVVCAIPGFFIIPMWWVIPESPRWLLQKKRLKEAEAVICKAAKMNRVLIPEVIFTSHQCLEPVKTNQEVKQTYTFLDLIRTSSIKSITIMGLFIWLSVVMVYYGLSLNTSNLNGNVFINCFISAVIDLVVYVASWYLVDYISRPVLLSSTLIFCGVMLLIMKLVPEDMDVVFQVLALSGRMGITCAYSFIYVFFIELMPTVVRNTGIGVLSTAGRLGAVISPYVIYIGIYSKVVPYIVFGIISILAAALSMFLPDTRNSKLPDEIHQVKPIRGCGCLKESTPENNSSRRCIEVEKSSLC